MVTETVKIGDVEHRAIRGFYPIPPEDAYAFSRGLIKLWPDVLPDHIKQAAAAAKERNDS